jgi:hypothetical protein
MDRLVAEKEKSYADANAINELYEQYYSAV